MRIFIEQFVSDYKESENTQNKIEETEENKNIIQVKFNSINPIHQTNAK